MGGCIDETIEVQRGSTAVLDVRIAFRDGGMCASQGVRILGVRRDTLTEGFAYQCSNIGGMNNVPCPNNTRFTVVDAGNCMQNCKYNIFLHLENFAESDVDVYTVVVEFEGLGDALIRSLMRRIRLQLVDGMYASVVCV